MSVLFYKRPDYVSKQDGPLDSSDCQKYVEKAACGKTSIPEHLSFDNVIEGKSMPPCSLQDFIDYLVYISHDAENLQFYLWLLDYTKRFENLSASEKAPSPEWKINNARPAFGRGATAAATEKGVPAVSVTEGSFYLDEDDTTQLTKKPPSQRQSDDSSPQSSLKPIEACVSESDVHSTQNLQSFAHQPFRSEITQIISHYINPSSPRELNISGKDRTSILHALRQTTHPSAFHPLLSTLGLTLRNQSHPNFIRWSICNGNQPRVFFLRSMAIWTLALGLIVAVSLVLSHHSRWWRIFVLPIWFSGIATLVAAHKGLCIVLYQLHTREIHPWEIDSPNLPLTPRPPTDMDPEAPPSPYSSERLSPFGSGNEYANEAWVDKWAMYQWWRKLMLKKVWVQEEGLRMIQNRIVKQAHAWGALISVSLTMVIVALPRGNLI